MLFKKDSKTKSNDTSGTRTTQNDPSRFFDHLRNRTTEENEIVSKEDTQDKPMPDWDKVTHSEYSKEYIKLYHLRQRLAGQLIDPKNADCLISWVQILDPYGLYSDLGPFEQIGKLQFACNPDIGIWVVDSDIPKDILEEIRRIHSRKSENSASPDDKAVEDGVNASESATQPDSDRDEWRTRIHSQSRFRRQLIELFQTSRKLGGMMLDPAIAETCIMYVSSSDPYELDYDPEGRTKTTCQERFARLPFDDFWIHEADIPEPIRKALWPGDEGR